MRSNEMVELATIITQDRGRYELLDSEAKAQQLAIDALEAHINTAGLSKEPITIK